MCSSNNAVSFSCGFSANIVLAIGIYRLNIPMFDEKLRQLTESRVTVASLATGYETVRQPKSQKLTDGLICGRACHVMPGK